MLENILTIIVVLCLGALIGIGVIFAILWTGLGVNSNDIKYPDHHRFIINRCLCRGWRNHRHSLFFLG